MYSFVWLLVYGQLLNAVLFVGTVTLVFILFWLALGLCPSLYNKRLCRVVYYVMCMRGLPRPATPAPRPACSWVFASYKTLHVSLARQGPAAVLLRSPRKKTASIYNITFQYSLIYKSRGHLSTAPPSLPPRREVVLRSVALVPLNILFCLTNSKGHTPARVGLRNVFASFLFSKPSSLDLLCCTPLTFEWKISSHSPPCDASLSWLEGHVSQRKIDVKLTLWDVGKEKLLLLQTYSLLGRGRTQAQS